MANFQIKSVTMHFQLNAAYFAGDLCCYDKQIAFCDIHKRHIHEPRYAGAVFEADKFVYFTKSMRSKGISRWPWALRVGPRLGLHQDVVEAFIAAKIDSARFHEVKEIRGKVLEIIPFPQPKYYVLEPLCCAEFKPSPEDFEVLSCACKLAPKNWGNLKHPMEIKWESYDGSDVFRVNYFYHSIMVTKRVIHVLNKHGWTDDFIVGSQKMPGIRITDFGPNWYEEAEARVKQLHPDFKVFV